MVDIDLFTVIALNMMVLQLGYTGKFEPLFYNYLRPLSSLDEGLYPLACEDDVHFLASLIRSLSCLSSIECGFTVVNSYQRSIPHVIEYVRRELSFEKTKLDGEAGFCDVVGNGIDISGLSNDESFRFDDFDLNVNLTLDLNISQTETQEEVPMSEVPVFEASNDHVVNESSDVGSTKEHVIVNEVVDGSGEEDVVHGSGEEDFEQGNGHEAFEETSDEKNEIVEPNVNVHLFSISKDVPFDEILVKAVQDWLKRDLELQISMSKAFKAKAKAKMEVKGDHILHYVMLKDFVAELQSTNLKTTVKITVKRNTDLSLPTRSIVLNLEVLLNAKPPHLISPCLSMECNQYVLIQIHHGGIFHKFSGKRYVYGHVDICDMVDIDLFTVIALNMMVLQLGYTGKFEPLFYNYLRPLSSLDEWLYPLVIEYVMRELSFEKTKLDGEAGFCDVVEEVPMSEVPLFEASNDHVVNEPSDVGSTKEHVIVNEVVDGSGEEDVVHGSGEEDFEQGNGHEGFEKTSGRALSDLLFNNICEVFNSKGKDKPVITLLEYIREYCMKRIMNVKSVNDKCTGPLTPTVTRIMKSIKKDAHLMKVQWNKGTKYQVSGSFGDKYVVDVVAMTCSCRKWESTWISCKYVVAGYWYMALNDQGEGTTPRSLDKFLLFVDYMKGNILSRVSGANIGSVDKSGDGASSLGVSIDGRRILHHHHHHRHHHHHHHHHGGANAGSFGTLDLIALGILVVCLVVYGIVTCLC
uniref:SWIM-type domain-containing protein n=1 Tax=Tanacetum cinerariifolium TaxID=118510 RepID=A0A6L2NPS0_TANCI|nr:hypothetical protein [Tanacetum cinerariifolium]